MKNVEDVLEIKKIKDELLSYSKTCVGKKRIETLTPSNDFEYVQKELNRLNEFMKMSHLFGELPVYSELDMEEEIKKGLKGDIFDEAKLNLIKTDIQNTVDLIKFSIWADGEWKYLPSLFVGLKANEDLFNLISLTVNANNEIKDNASKDLARIREELSKMKKSIYTTLSSLMAHHKDRVAGDNFVMRNGHYAIPVSTSQKAGVEGIVQDVSDSGQTTFILPKEILELENKITILQLEEREEINRILRQLTKKVLEDDTQLIKNNKIIGELDFIQAKAKYAHSIEANIPSLTKERCFKLYNARHPLISKDICVPNDFILGGDKRLMLISGPNAGGKTVSLKTVAICAYMTKMGLAIPASADSEIYLFNKIYTEIGDSQSIESNLSTFSAHISSFAEVFKSITSNDLVIIDEICNGTDPKEGDALAIAIVKALLKTNALSLVTSHYDGLKKYGLTNNEILNASFLFNKQDITPTFKILLGASGKSYGFLISKKYGLDDSIISDARKIYENSFETEDDKKRRSINEKERYLLQKEQKLKERQDALNTEHQKNIAYEKELKNKEMELKNAKIDKFDAFLEDKYNEISEIYNEFLRDKNALKAQEKLEKINVKKKRNENIEVGTYVEIKNLGIVGKVTSVQGTKITIRSNDGFTLNTTKDKCEVKEPPRPKAQPRSNVDDAILKGKNISMELNLIGKRVDEAIAELDKYLDDCILRGYKEVKVIHGYGTGRLRIAIHDFLKGKKNIKEFRLGGEFDGGSGSTLIKFK